MSWETYLLIICSAVIIAAIATGLVWAVQEIRKEPVRSAKTGKAHYVNTTVIVTGESEHVKC